MNLSLYEMKQEWEAVFEKLLDPEIPEDAIFDTIEMIEADMDTKADSYDTMKATGRTKFKTALFSFAIQKNGGAQPVKLLDDVPEAWRKPGLPDMAKIREYLADGNDLPFAALEERGESLRIR